MITVAILGGGFMGASHAANYKALGERVRVKTVASRTPERAAKVAEVVGAEVSDDLDAAIRDPDVDAVDICLPTPLHREFAERALAAGKSVFLEKPIALTTEDADAIVAAASRSDAVFMVGMVLRFWPEYASCSASWRRERWDARGPSRPSGSRRRRTGTTGWPTARSPAGPPSTS